MKTCEIFDCKFQSLARWINRYEEQENIKRDDKEEKRRGGGGGWGRNNKKREFRKRQTTLHTPEQYCWTHGAP